MHTIGPAAAAKLVSDVHNGACPPAARFEMNADGASAALAFMRESQETFAPQ